MTDEAGTAERDEASGDAVADDETSGGAVAGGERYDCALAAARAGASEAMERFRTGLAVESKADRGDSVTAADYAAQRAALDVIEREFGEPVAAEEGDAPAHVPREGPGWAVDPIDGTNNYARGGRVWATSVAATIDGDPVAAATVAPALGDTYTATRETALLNGQSVGVSDETDPERFLVNPQYGLSPLERRGLAETVRTITERFGDLRRIGCTQLALAGVARGELEAVVSTTPVNDWDAIAGVALVRRAGGRVTDVTGQRWTPGAAGMVASNDEAHAHLVESFEPPE